MRNNVRDSMAFFSCGGGGLTEEECCGAIHTFEGVCNSMGTGEDFGKHGGYLYSGVVAGIAYWGILVFVFCN